MNIWHTSHVTITKDYQVGVIENIVDSSMALFSR